MAALCAARGTRGEVRPPTQTPFATSDRRVRGTIVRTLREAPAGLGVAALTRAVGDARVPALVAGLTSEGLVARRGTRIVLGS